MPNKILTRVLLFGKDGMVGSSIFSKLSINPNIKLVATSRHKDAEYFFDINKSSLTGFINLHKPNYIINCIGAVKPNYTRINDAFQANTIFSLKLARLVFNTEMFLIQFSTDGVFYGRKGNYFENEFRFPRSLYSFTKILGERSNSNSLIIRTSIIGQENNYVPKSILSWLEYLPKYSIIPGYTNYSWNGVTNKNIADLCQGIISNSYTNGTIQNFIPSDDTSKYQLLLFLRDLLDRHDVKIVPKKLKSSIDRRLKTNSIENNKLFWNFSGYSEVPTIRDTLYDLFNKQIDY
jgi:dTDP-4-dehydrorhamnose reductase